MKKKNTVLGMEMSHYSNGTPPEGVQTFQECSVEVRIKHFAFPESSFVFRVHVAILVLI